MSEKRIGTLIYDPSMGRYDIRFVRYVSVLYVTIAF